MIFLGFPSLWGLSRAWGPEILGCLRVQGAPMLRGSPKGENYDKVGEFMFYVLSLFEKNVVLI